MCSRKSQLFVFISMLSCLGARASDLIKVKINSPTKRIKLSSTEDMKVSLFGGASKKSKKMIINCDFSRRQVFSKSLLASVESQNPISFNGKIFKGKFDIIARRRGGCELINSVEIENYVSSLLSKEMNSKWPVEALKAQAVAARSYALSKRSKNIFSSYHIESSEREQVSGSYGEQNLSTDLAAYMTKDLVLADKNNGLVEAYYHAMCGGKIFNANKIWNGTFHGFEQRSCEYCDKFKKNGYEDVLSENEFIKLLRRKGLNFKTIISFTNSDSAVSVRGKNVGNEVVVKKILKKDIRRYIKSSRIKSFNFNVNKIGEQIYVKGHGNGHGVGMCQMGALAMAQAGKTYKEIIKYYYPHFKIISKGELK